MATLVSFRQLSESLFRMDVDSAAGPDIRLLNQLVVGMTLGGIVILAVVGGFFLSIGANEAGVTYMAYLVVNIANLLLFRAGHLSTRRFVAIQMVLVIVVGFFTSTFLGGVVNSGGVLFYGFLSPLAGLLCFGTRVALLAFLGFAVSLFGATMVTAFDVVDPVLPRQTALTLLAFNMTALGLFVIATLSYFVTQRDRAFRALKAEEDRSEALLLNILPASIATTLKTGATAVARHHDEASILFADVANFTPLAARLSPATVVDLLNEVFTEFDALVEKHGLEKIKTIGDAYMVAAGVPEPRADHALAITQLALEMMDTVRERRFQGCELQFRIGINSGPVVAGVIGRRKFSYDLWGDTVNTASRLEQYGVPGRIQIGEATQRLIAERYETEPRGQVELKGKGLVTAYFVTSEVTPKPEPSGTPAASASGEAVALAPLAPPQPA